MATKCTTDTPADKTRLHNEGGGGVGVVIMFPAL